MEKNEFNLLSLKRKKKKKKATSYSALFPRKALAENAE